MSRTKGSRNGNRKARSNRGGLHKRYWNVPDNVQRVLYRPYVKRLYWITAARVVLCNPDTWDKETLLRKGYVVAAGTDKNQTVLERTVNNEQ